MLYNRQRLLLALLHADGGDATEHRFQRLLRAYTRQLADESPYAFVPVDGEPRSLTADVDRQRLVARGLLRPGPNWHLTNTGRDEARARSDLLGTVRGFIATHDRADRQGDGEGHGARQRPRDQGPAILTIGYEGKNLDAYLEQLLGAGVTILVDVRRNPISRKAGFSKSALEQACRLVGVRYEHVPSLGIDAALRRDLETRADYDALFAHYRAEQLPHQGAALARIVRWLDDDGERVALTCYELAAEWCHRSCVAAALESRSVRVAESIHLGGTCQANRSS